MPPMRTGVLKSGATSKIESTLFLFDPVQGGRMTPQECLSAMEALVCSQKVMTLAVALEAGAWSSPVYYIYHQRAFYFFSSPDSRHIRESKNKDGRAGASIFADAVAFDDIRGIQMTGIIEAAGKCAAPVAAAYLKRFNIFHAGMDALAFIRQQYRAAFYRFIPCKLIYMDNAVFMGFKKELEFGSLNEIQQPQGKYKFS